MKDLFELPELFTLEGKSFSAVEEPVICNRGSGCVMGCNIGCYIGSKPEDTMDKPVF